MAFERSDLSACTSEADEVFKALATLYHDPAEL